MRIVKKPVVNPENNAATQVPTMPRPTVTSTSENPAVVRCRCRPALFAFWIAIFITGAIRAGTNKQEFCQRLRGARHVPAYTGAHEGNSSNLTAVKELCRGQDTELGAACIGIGAGPYGIWTADRAERRAPARQESIGEEETVDGRPL